MRFGAQKEDDRGPDSLLLRAHYGDSRPEACSAPNKSHTQTRERTLEVSLAASLVRRRRSSMMRFVWPKRAGRLQAIARRASSNLAASLKQRDKPIAQLCSWPVIAVRAKCKSQTVANQQVDGSSLAALALAFLRNCLLICDAQNCSSQSFQILGLDVEANSPKEECGRFNRTEHCSALILWASVESLEALFDLAPVEVLLASARNSTSPLKRAPK